MATGFTINPLGDDALIIEFGDEINVETNQRVIALQQYLKINIIEGIIDIIPAYTTLTIVYNISVIKKLSRDQIAFKWLQKTLISILQKQLIIQKNESRKLSIPVCYHPSLAPDIEWLADQHQLTTDEVISLHSSTIYQVYMLGFLPGFPYMATVNQKLATPRKSTPRKIVAAGSVGIAGNQTGIYPFASPGGWQLIGKTPISIFDINEQQPALFQPGDVVNFYPITLEEFNHLQEE